MTATRRGAFPTVGESGVDVASFERLLCVDYGLRKIGLAMVSSRLDSPEPMAVLPNDGNVTRVTEVIARIVRDNRIECVVVGKPVQRNPRLAYLGDYDFLTMIFRDFCHALKDAIASQAAPVGPSRAAADNDGTPAAKDGSSGVAALASLRRRKAAREAMRGASSQRTAAAVSRLSRLASVRPSAAGGTSSGRRDGDGGSAGEEDVSVPVYFFNEQFSTQYVKSLRISGAKGGIDAYAACAILDHFLGVRGRGAEVIAPGQPRLFDTHIASLCKQVWRVLPEVRALRGRRRQDIERQERRASR
ncbi:unnamed protein product [Vitrella brassicaformis CCMP3155]|uniref:YqgF/RNase H-like domain-containing protein n=2 Tax=Vitrella brassicaformis TaxID=1169539 RepID=A0A0G4H7Z9_VITBC|nr:unnamed protein product [Vitrella brassicaformis CCMP3155]|eukprot:CEM39900.1 unnamed protein product [Vitrella brassicaformis CCMP3155]